MKPLILGEAPGKGKAIVADLFPLSGPVGVTLCQLAGLEDEALSTRPGTSRYGHYYWTLKRHYDLDNLLEEYPGRAGKGAAFPVDVARQVAEQRRDEWHGKVMILLGARMKRVFFTQRVPFYEWFWWPYYGTSVAAIPHPSGLNRAYNEQSHKDRARLILQQAIERTER